MELHREYIGKQPINAQITAVSNFYKYKYKNIFFRDRQQGLRKNESGSIFFLIKYELVMNFQRIHPLYHCECS